MLVFVGSWVSVKFIGLIIVFGKYASLVVVSVTLLFEFVFQKAANPSNPRESVPAFDAFSSIERVFPNDV